MSKLVSQFRRRFSKHDPQVVLPCGCTTMKNGYCKVRLDPKTSSIASPTPDSRKARRSQKKNNVMMDVKDDLEDVVKCFDVAFKLELAKLVERKEKDQRTYTEEAMHSAFYEWATTCLMDDVARHVHHVMRSEFSFVNIARQGALERQYRDYVNGDEQSNTWTFTESFVVPSPRDSLRPLGPVNQSPTSKSDEGSPRFFHAAAATAAVTTTKTTRIGGKRGKNLLRAALQSPTNGADTGTASSTTTELLIDSSLRKRGERVYRFLGTTVNEKVADQRLLAKYQKCIEVLSGALTSHGGQMRQFIVDDKGTVCIGTFGLRGAVSDDNSAAALKTAHSIIVQLQALGISCSIGVTVGKTYCGLVGSSSRHEYAVMGPSTNLSARLMCKAPAFGVICDIETRKRDRTHNFVTLESIVAKGYADPVGTFKPIFPDLESENVPIVRVSSHETEPKEEKSVDSKLMSSSKLLKRMIECSSSEGQLLHGRLPELEKTIMFMFMGVALEATSSLKTELNAPHVFRIACPCRSVGIISPDGMGKSRFANHVAERVSDVCRHTAGCNIQLFRGQIDSYRSGTPFHAWKPILVELIIRICRLHMKLHESKRKSVVASSEILEGVNRVMSLLPKDHQHMKPLFEYLTITPSSSKELPWSEAEKMELSIQLFVAVLKLYSRSSRNLLFITIEDVHAFGVDSMRLLHAVHSSCTGVVMLFTGRKHVKITGIQDSEDIMSNLMVPLRTSTSFLEVELGCLSKADTIELIKMEMKEAGIQEGDASFFDQVYTISGGNPLYALEIAKTLPSVSKKGGRAPATHNARTEDVICFRFDQLKASSQILLKLVAVICANKASFSLTMLEKLVEWDLLEGCVSFTDPIVTAAKRLSVYSLQTHSATRVSVAKILLQVLCCENFLRVCVRDDHKAPDSFSLDSLLNGSDRFEFAIPLEQSTIYNLLLDDQKHALHAGIAKYLNRCKHDEEEYSTVEEAFHWYNAAVWSQAMVCYYEAHEKETLNVTRHNEFLMLAYSALQIMAGNGELKHLGISFRDLDEMFKGATIDADERSAKYVETSGATVMTLERIYSVFSGDSKLLYTGLVTLVDTASKNMHGFEHFVSVQLILEDALQILLLTKNPFLMSSHYLDHFNKDKLDMRVNGEGLNADDLHFRLHNFWPLCFRILSNYCMNYIMSSVVASDYSRKALFIAEQFLNHARTEGTPLDVIQALKINALMQNKLCNLKASFLMMEELNVKYVFETHSPQLIASYGADHMIYVLTRTIKYIIMTGDQEKANGYIATAMHWFLNLTHVPSLTLTVLRLVSVLAFVERYDECFKLLAHYEAVIKHLFASEKVPFLVIEFYRAWLGRRVARMVNWKEPGAESKETNDLISHFEVLISNKDRKLLEKNTWMVYHHRELMILMADLYTMKVREAVVTEAQLTNDCLVCCMNLQAVVDAPVLDTHDIFCKARAVRIALEFIKVLRSVAGENEECYKQLRKLFPPSILVELKRDAQVNQLFAMSEDVTKLKEQLHERY